MFTKGDEVLARHPSSKEYDTGKIIDVKGNSYKIKFAHGGEHVISGSDVRTKRTSRSSTRIRGKTVKSPSRASPSRRRSPGRSAKSPARIKKTISPIMSAKYAKVAIARIDLDKEYTDETSTTDATESLEGSDLLPVQSRLKELRPVTRRSTRIMASKESLLSGRSSDRATSLPVERSILKDEKERGVSMQKDRELSTSKYDDEKLSDTGSEKQKLEISFIAKPKEWAGWCGALILLLIAPLSILLPQLACINGRCKTAHFRVPKDWRAYFNLNAYMLYAGFVLSIAIASMLPIGRRVDVQLTKIGRLQYRTNGILIAILALGTFGGSIYKGYKIHNFILEQSLQLAVCGWLMGTILALALYIKGGRAPIAHQNMYASTNSSVYNFWQGREINPRIKSLDFKMLLSRSALIGAIIMNSAVAVKAVENVGKLNIKNLDLTTLIAVMMMMIYLIDQLLIESYFFTSFEMSQEGTGYMLCMGYFIYPFLSSLTTRYFLYNKINYNVYLMTACFLLFIIGYSIYRYSNLQKDKFRKNPFDSSLSHLETISTSRGKRLIVSGLWGHVRHPNYLGDIIFHWSIALLVLVADVLPYYTAIFTTLMLMYRAIRDNARCKTRYELAWDQYCSRVKYMIFKKIF